MYTFFLKESKVREVFFRQSPHPKIAGRRVVVDRKSSEWTLMIKGDLDGKGNGSAFAKAGNMLSQSEPVPNILLTVAALATRGDILELGTSVSSSPLLHRIAEAGKRSNYVVGVFVIAIFKVFCYLSLGHHPLLQGLITKGMVSSSSPKVWYPQTLTLCGFFGWPTRSWQVLGTRFLI